MRVPRRTARERGPEFFSSRDTRESLAGGRLAASNLNNVLKKTSIRLAAEVDALRFSKDVIVDL